MTSNKKLVTILLFVAALAFSVLALIVGLQMLEATDLLQILYITQAVANLSFISSILSLCVMIALISDMD